MRDSERVRIQTRQRRRKACRPSSSFQRRTCRDSGTTSRPTWAPSGGRRPLPCTPPPSSPPAPHEPTTALAQAYYNKQEGVKRITTETGAGQWGSALAMACNFFGIELKVYMVKVSYHQKPYRRSMMETWGASVVPSPSPDTHAGRPLLEP